jgi:transposase
MAKGRPASLRLETPERRQMRFEQTCLDDVLSADHRARQVWDYVEGLDLSLLYAEVRTTVSSTGRPAIDPAVLVALWLYATMEGVGSARYLDRLCKRDLAYLWLLGGVTVNYHTLADFRTKAGPQLDALLSQSISGMMAAGVVNIDTIAVDGMRLQTLASAASFRSGEGLLELENEVLEEVRRLRAEIDEDATAAANRTTARRLAMNERRLRKIEQARQAHAEIKQHREEQQQKQRRKTAPREPRVSPVEPEARIMKMADGSYRPAYNVQIKTAVHGAFVIGLSVSEAGTDYGLLEPALDEVEQRYGKKPDNLLADGGYFTKSNINRLDERRVTLFCPLRRRDNAEPKPGDSEAVIAWRERMSDAAGKDMYKRRFATERPHAVMRGQGLRRLLVRGKDKARAVLLWHVHAFNLQQFFRLKAA